MAAPEILQNLNVGLGVAEQETDGLAAYFVRTNQWRRILKGEVDVIYGPKGSGKSALYTLLITTPPENSDCIVIPADSPRGTPAFKRVEVNPPTSETEFQGLWKLYFAALIGNHFVDRSPKMPRMDELVDVLASEGLIDENNETVLARILSWLSRRRPGVQGGVSIDPATGGVKAEGRIVLDESPSSESSGKISINKIIEKANAALQEHHKTVWIAIDRLDVAFIDNVELEENALRALFHAYLDLLRYDNIKLKIFLRIDIWKRLTTSRSFPEASHIVRQSTIEWSEEQLLNLVMRRLLNNGSIVASYHIDKDSVLADVQKQSSAFYKIFPRQVISGERRPSAFSWMVTRTADGTKQTAPRELIQLLNQAREEQLRNIEIGASDALGEDLFGGSAIKKALDGVSRQRLNQTIYPEYPALKPFIEKLEGQKAEQTVETLASLWKCSTEEAQAAVTRLVDIGFFEKRGSGDSSTLWIPFIYRPALKIVQGSAEE
jgi:energy-coupling factor transporter ATP-binding protein EcfA2